MEEKVTDRIHKLAVDLAKLEVALLGKKMDGRQASWLLSQISAELNLVNLDLVREAVSDVMVERLTRLAEIGNTVEVPRGKMPLGGAALYFQGTTQQKLHLRDRRRAVVQRE